MNPLSLVCRSIYMAICIVTLFNLTTVSAAGPPYPQSSVIESLIWAPSNTIIRKASGSDCWPITWADNGHLYTAYGDGWGFDPKVSEKLSMGFAKIQGSAANFTGINIRSNDEQYGGGKSGKKPSGMIMVGGTLYMWVRNAAKDGTQSELWYSTNHGVDWTDVGWNFAELGYLTFINFGLNYKNARDNYVYAVSHDNPSAYKSADQFVLLRCPKNGLTKKENWKFLASNNKVSTLWSSNSSDRVAVFRNPGNCLRSGISYNSGLKRYIWWQQNGGSVDTRFNGGFGVYDAPEPWGPWTTVFYTNNWDVGPGETASFPTKWMSDDGKTMYLVFSGEDAFSVRKATLNVSGTPPIPPTGLKILSDY